MERSRFHFNFLKNVDCLSGATVPAGWCRPALPESTKFFSDSESSREDRLICFEGHLPPSRFLVSLAIGGAPMWHPLRFISEIKYCWQYFPIGGSSEIGFLVLWGRELPGFDIM